MSSPKRLEQSLPGLWRIFLALRPYLAGQRLLIAGSLAALLAGVALRVLEPWPLKIVFDHVIVVKKGGGNHAARVIPPSLVERQIGRAHV